MNIHTKSRIDPYELLTGEGDQRADEECMLLPTSVGVKISTNSGKDESLFHSLGSEKSDVTNDVTHMHNCTTDDQKSSSSLPDDDSKVEIYWDALSSLMTTSQEIEDDHVNSDNDNDDNDESVSISLGLDRLEESDHNDAERLYGRKVQPDAEIKIQEKRSQSMQQSEGESEQSLSVHKLEDESSESLTYTDFAGENQDKVSPLLGRSLHESVFDASSSSFAHYLDDIKEWSLVKILGEGNFGQVWQVERKSMDVEDDRSYALKMLSKYHLLCDGEVDSVIEEKRILQMVNRHPFVTKLRAAWQDENLVCECLFCHVGMNRTGCQC